MNSRWHRGLIYGLYINSSLMEAHISVRDFFIIKIRMVNIEYDTGGVLCLQRNDGGAAGVRI